MSPNSQRCAEWPTAVGQRIKLGDTYFHNGPIGLSATSTAGVDTGFNREPEGTLNSMTRGGKAYYYLTDALGSVVATADESGAKVNSYFYSPRGVTRGVSSEKIAQPYRCAGGYQDVTGLYHFAARYYDPNIGRFNSPDPSGQEKNPYLYAEGDPVNRIDPTGLFSFKDLGIDTLIGAVGGAVTGCVGGAVTAGIVGSAAGPGGTTVGALGGCAIGAAGGGSAGVAGGAVTSTLNQLLK
ncbi:RHS repeat-associated core domain-containing protein [Streptomyces sp. NPDC058268]|uniref:RHS repeat-associated core domain-containing protein n=1 Tax=Streptomyces sp. NPDC058268 TaxID=3346413 RepID=UPI0036E33426